ncbi:MAG: response regulator [Deltaproteobacteria bacterium]|nr:response regulator [Deltaproteobacteria bacterium]
MSGEAGTKTVLIVDADGASRSFLAGLLRPRGLAVVQARTAADTRLALGRHSIQLLIIDAQLPDEEGAQLVRTLRRQGVTLPVIFLAAGWLDHGSYKTLTGELGVRRVMHKPFSAYQFVSEVEGTLSRAARPPTIPPAPDEAATKPRRMRSDPSFPAVDGPSPYGAAVSLVVVGKDETLEASLREAAAAAIVSVTTVADGAEAARRAAREHFDGALFLVDPADPDLAFAEATELLCSDAGKGLPAGFVCSEDRVALQVDAIHAGGVAFLSAPIKPRHVRQAAATMAQLRRGRQPAVVIVADDIQVAALSGVLEPAKLRLESLPDAHSLLDYLSHTEPDLILYSLDLPGVSGLDVSKLLRASPRWCALPLVLLSGNSSAEARIAAYDAGADDFIVLPVDEDELFVRVTARVQRYRTAREAADKDPLTGVLRRHAFIDRAGAMIAAAARSGSTVAIGILSLERSERRADEPGPVVDNAALAKLGTLVAQKLRAYDLCARWGDDAVIVALTDVDARTADRLLDRLLGGFAEVEPGLPCRAGLAVFPDDEQTIPTLVRAARSRLRRAQDNGQRVSITEC